MKHLRLLSIVATCAISTAMTIAQQVSMVGVGFVFTEPETNGDRKANIVLEWWCSSPDLATVDIRDGLVGVPLRKGKDFRDLKSVTVIDSNGTAVNPDRIVKDAYVFGMPVNRRIGSSSSEVVVLNELKKVGAPRTPRTTSTRTSNPLTSPAAILRDANVPYGKDKPVKFVMSRQGLSETPKMATRLKVDFRVSDGVRPDGALDMVIETTDSRMVHLNIGSLGDSSAKSMTEGLELPIPENGIKRVHFIFKNRPFTLGTTVQRNNDPFLQADDTRFQYTITGLGPTGPIPFVTRQSVTMTNWTNFSTADLSTAPMTYVDDFINLLGLYMQTGAAGLNRTAGSATKMRLKLVVRDKDRKEQVLLTFDPANSSRVPFICPPGFGNGIFLGGFQSNDVAWGKATSRLEDGFRISDIDTVTLSILPENESPSGSFTESWDLAGISIGARMRPLDEAGMTNLALANNFFDQTSLFTDFTYNQQLNFNFNQQGRGSSFKTFQFSRTPIAYTMALGTAR